MHTHKRMHMGAKSPDPESENLFYNNTRTRRVPKLLPTLWTKSPGIQNSQLRGRMRMRMISEASMLADLHHALIISVSFPLEGQCYNTLCVLGL